MPSSQVDLAEPATDAFVPRKDQNPERYQPPVARRGNRRRIDWLGVRGLLVALACALVIVNTALAVVVVRSLWSIYVQVQETQDVLTTLYRLDADIRRISGIHRDYMLTGLPPFLADYRAARQQVAPVLAQLRALAADRPDQQGRIDVVQRQLAEADSTVSAAIAQGRAGPDSAELQALLGPKRLYDSVQHIIADMYVDEGILEAARIGTVAERTQQALLISVLRTIVVVVLAALLLYMARRHKTTRDRLVAERATALASADMALQREAAERRQVEDTLRSREMLLRGLSNAMPQIAFVAYADGTGEFINRRWHDYTGAADTFADGVGWEGVVHPNDLGSVRLRWQETVRLTAPFMMECRLRGTDGRYRWFLAQAVPVDELDNGDRAHWAGTLTDIDDIRRADRALREARIASAASSKAVRSA